MPNIENIKHSAIQKKYNKTMITIKNKNILSKFAVIFMTAAILLSSVPAPAFAVIYAPGATLNPSCLPTDTNCDVDTSAFANTGINLASATSTPAITTSQLYNIGGALYWNGSAIAGLSGPSAVTSLNGLATSTQTFAVGSTGTDFNIVSSTSTHTFNLPSATSTVRGLLTSADWTNFNNKQSQLAGTAGQVLYFSGANMPTATSTLFLASNGNIGIGTTNPGQKLEVAGSVLANRFNANSTSSPFQINGTTVLNIGNGTTFVGDSAGANNQALALNATFVGYHAGQNNTTGIFNTAVGGAALISNTTGSSNTANGATALSANTTGGNNSAFGAMALQSSITGSDNTGVGSYVLFLNTGNSNTAIGSGALLQSTTGGSNTALGNVAGSALTTGSDNTLLGAGAGGNLTTGNRNIIIGSGISAPLAVSNNQLSIGNLIFGAGLNATGTAISTGNIGIGAINPSSKLQVAGVIESTGLLFNEGANSVIGFNYPDTTYDRRLRLTAGKTDTADNSQGASIDLHGNAAGGSLDLVAGGATGALTFWTNNTQRAVIDANGNVGIGTAAPGATLAVNSVSATNNPLSVGGQINVSEFPNYLYRAPITVTAGGSLADYQTSVVVNTAVLVTAGKMQADGRDIRITASDSATLQNYWIETGTMNTTATRIWFKAGSLISGDNTFYLYYGNPSAIAASNGDNVFTFFDDFNGSAVDATKWIVDDATGISVSGGSLNATNNNAKLRSQWSYAGTPVIQETQAIFNTEFSVPHYVTYGGFWSSGSDGISFIRYRPNTFMPAPEDGYFIPENILPYSNTNSVPLGTEFLSRASVISGTQVAAQTINYSTSALINDQTHTNTVSNGERILLVRAPHDASTNAAGNMSIRFVRVRQYTASEPTANIGSEGTTPTTTAPATFLTVNSSGNVLPGSDSAYDLGSATNRWRDLYLSGATLHLGEMSLSANAGGSLVWSGASIETTPSATSSSEIHLSELSANGSNYTGFKSPDALAANILYTLPTADGASGQVLSTNGTGALAWATPLTNAITSLNGLATSTQTFAVGATGADFGITSSGSTHTFNLPDAGATVRGLVSTSAQIFAGNKTLSGNTSVGGTFNVIGASTLATSTATSLTLSPMTAGSLLFAGAGGLMSQNNAGLFWDNTNSRLGIGTAAPSAKLDVAGTSDVTQLLVRANSTQSNSNPLIKLVTSEGTELLRVHSDNENNTFVGKEAGRVNAPGSFPIGQSNTFIGSKAGYSNTTGKENTGTGFKSLYSNTTGVMNTAYGINSLYSNTTGSYNDAGPNGLYSNTSGSNNTANGTSALFSNTTGFDNTAIGFKAGYSESVALQTNSSSTFIGNNANTSVDGLTNVVVIGSTAQATQSNQVVLGNTSITQTILRGNVGIGTAAPGAKLEVVGSARFQQTSAADGAADTLASGRGLNNVAGGLAFDQDVYGLAGVASVGGAASGGSANTSDIIGVYGKASVAGGVGANTKIFGVYGEGSGTGSFAGYFQGNLYASGNVGIGTAAPTAKLEITPASANALRINPYGAGAGNTGDLQFMELAANGANYTGFKSPDALAANVLYTLPSSDGASGQTLSTNGTGALAWTTAGVSSQWTTSGSNIYYNAGNVAIGSATPSATAKLLITGVVPPATTNPGLVSGNGVVDTTTVSGQTIITYTTTGATSFTPPTGVTSVDYLVVAGGGGGGGGTSNAGGAGAGAGGVVYSTSQAVAAGSITVAVGAGGVGGGANANGSNGNNSSFGTTIATGGGGGGSNNNNGSAGGSGGGGGYNKAGGSGTSGQGNNGGNGAASTFGGGGGAVSAGGNAGSSGGNGGSGISNSISGAAVTYAGGGAGSYYDFPPSCTGPYNGTGGSGGGGNVCGAGTANTGGGAGGSGVANGTGPSGGSGIVIVRFATQTITPANQALLRVTDTGTAASTTLAFFEGTSGTGCIVAGGTGLTCSSDITLKKHVNALGDSLGNVLALKAVTFDWKNGANDTEDNAGITGGNIGFIAQDVEKIFPGLVVLDPNGKKMLAYDRFAPIIVKAIQEQYGGMMGVNIASVPNAADLFSSTSTLDALAQAKAGDNFIVDPISYIREKVASGIKIVRNLITERIVAVEGYFKRIFANELCLTDSSGALVCVTGDQLKNIGGQATVGPSQNASIQSAPLPANETATDNATTTPANTNASSTDATTTPDNTGTTTPSEASQASETILPTPSDSPATQAEATPVEVEASPASDQVSAPAESTSSTEAPQANSQPPQDATAGTAGQSEPAPSEVNP